MYHFELCIEECLDDERHASVHQHDQDDEQAGGLVLGLEVVSRARGRERTVTRIG